MLLTNSPLSILQSLNRKQQGEYPTASKLATVAFILSIMDVVATLSVGLVITDIVVYAHAASQCSSIYRDYYTNEYSKF